MINKWNAIYVTELSIVSRLVEYNDSDSHFKYSAGSAQNVSGVDLMLIDS